jgi:hypothetical protein
MQAANFCSKHGGEEAQSGQLICSLPDVSVETHPSTNLTAAWLPALPSLQVRLSLKLRSIRKSQLGASKIRRRFFVHTERRKSGAPRAATRLDLHQSQQITSHASQLQPCRPAEPAPYDRSTRIESQYRRHLWGVKSFPEQIRDSSGNRCNPLI